MSGVSSASPENLQVFVKNAGAATERLASARAAAGAVVSAFYDAPCDPRFAVGNGEAAFNQLQALIAKDGTDERWIAGVRRAFIEADTNTLPDATIAASLRAQGISPDRPSQLTADEPVYHGATIYSGWTDDPVSTGSGNFYEPESDLAMPAALSALVWPRNYSSRFVAESAHGPGWHSWADTRLVVEDSLIVYHGPDGQEAPLARSGPGEWLPHPGLEADLRHSPEGYELTWRWESRFPAHRWMFDPSGLLVSIRVSSDSVFTLERDREGRLVAMAHTGGRRLEISWQEGLVAEVRSSDGRRVGFTYDSGRLVDVRRPGGGRRYVYDGSGRLAEVFDDDGVRLVANTYDDDGRVLTQVSPHGRKARFRYRPVAAVVVGDDDGGPSTLYRHDGAGRMTEIQMSDGSRAVRRFDSLGRPVEVIDPGGRSTRRAFDERGHCVAEERDGSTRSWEHDGHGRVCAAVGFDGVELRYTYDGDGPHPAAVEGPLGFRTRFELSEGRIVGAEDSDGVMVRLDYDPDGQVVAVTDGEGGVTRFGYHPSGQLAYRESGTGQVTTWSYDADGRAVAVETPDGARYERRFSPAGRLLEERGPDGARIAYSWGSHGSLEAVTGADGTRTQVDWDLNGDLRRVTDGEGGDWRLGWDGLGRLESMLDPTDRRWDLRWARGDHLAALVDPLGHCRTYELEIGDGGRAVTVTTGAGRSYRLRWDGADRLLGGDTPEGDGSLEIRYDAAGRPAGWLVDGHLVAEAGYTAAGRLETLSRPGAGTWRFRYDRAGRSVELDGPDGVERVVHDPAGRPVRVERPGETTDISWDGGDRPTVVSTAGRTSRLDYDRCGRLAGLVGPDGTRWTWSRDRVGRIRAVAGPGGGGTVVSRDRCGRVVAAVGPEGGQWSYRRDRAGRLLELTDPLRRTTRYTWDGAGRISRVDLPDGSARLYRWDGDGGLVRVDATGPTGTDRGVLAVESDWSCRSVTIGDGADRRIRLDLDGRGRVVAWADGADGGAGSRVDWQDPARPVIESADGERLSTQLSPSGLPLSVEHPVLGSVRLERDPQGRLLRVEAAGLVREWRRDGAGDAVGYREVLDGRVSETHLERDRAGRVIAERSGRGECRYRYDPAGRLLSADGVDGRWEWEYDRAGRVVAERSPAGERCFGYDPADQLLSITDADGVTRVAYDGLGRRVSEDGPTGAVRYHWDGADRLVAMELIAAGGEPRRVEMAYDPLGRLVEVGGVPLGWAAVEGPFGVSPARIGEFRMVGLPGVPLARIGPDGEIGWVSADWRGSVGAHTVWGGADHTPAHPELGFLGEIHVGRLIWLRNRWYDPQTHSFLSRDPRAGSLMEPAATNPYLYANNDPLRFVDPLGLRPLTASQASAQISSWRQGHWKELVVTAAAVAAGVVLVAVAPEAGALILPMVLGAAGGAGGTVVNDLWHHHPIDWGQVVMDGALGAALGGGAGALGGAGSLMEPVSRAVSIGAGAAGGAGFTATDRWATNAPFSWTDEAIGAAGGAVGGLAPHASEDVPWESMSDLTEAQRAVVRSGNRAANFYAPRVAAAQAMARAAGVAARHTNIMRDSSAGFFGAVGAGAGTPPDADPSLPPSSVHFPPVAPPSFRPFSPLPSLP